MKHGILPLVWLAALAMPIAGQAQQAPQVSGRTAARRGEPAAADRTEGRRHPESRVRGAFKGKGHVVHRGEHLRKSRAQ